ncbi:hypothetical protein [Capnocytophaga canis]|uniref:hypothetical protein n=1 Tax=Capnocytophaga canis TaxID=1848903 RepID=UPI001561C3C1|nr:hypothetical protein [Capnocytophaga canis]
MNTRIFFEYAYLIISIYAAFQAYRLWDSTDRKDFYMYLIFGVVAFGMFLLRRFSRKKGNK